MSKVNSKVIIKIIIAVAISVATALLVELGCNIKLFMLSADEKGTKNIDMDTVSYNDGRVSFDYDGYIKQLKVEYEHDSYFEQNIIVEYENAYKKQETEVLKDTSPKFLDSSSHNISRRVKKITLEPIDEYNEDKVSSAKITGISIINKARFNGRRFLLFTAFPLSVLLLIFFRKTIAKKVELGFLIVGVSAGLVMTLSMPLTREGFDEETHLRNTYLLSLKGSTEADDTVWEMLNTGDGNHPLVHADTLEEHNEFLKYLNDNANYFGTKEHENYTVTPRHTSGMATPAYIFGALAGNIGRLFKMGFGNIIIMIRLTTLLVYLVVMYFAIKIVKKGKILMALIGLTPTALFLASTISYDPIVTSFMYLGFAFLYNRLIDKETKPKWWQYGLAICALGFGCMAKAIYAPMILAFLLVPKDRYENDKSRKIVKAGTVAAFVLLILSFTLPILLGHTGGDARGGDTGTGSQISSILANPFAFAGLLIRSIGTNVLRFTIGPLALDCFAHLSVGNTIIAIDALMIFVLLTHSQDDRAVNKKAAWSIFAAILVSTILIWTSMYLSFTEVGVLKEIAGVQGRYFIPLLFPLLIILPTHKIKLCDNRERIWYNSVVLTCIGAILFWEIYSQILKVCCF